MDFKKGKGIVAQGRQNILNGYLLFHDEKDGLERQYDTINQSNHS